MVLEWTEDEARVLEEIRRAGAFLTESDAVRGALFWYARFLFNLDMPAGTFGLARPKPVRRRRKRSARQDDQGDLDCEEHEGFLG
jgi:hypothetical protein